MSLYHRPVMVDEVLRELALRPDDVVIDLTLGGGGHSARLLEKLGDKGRVIGFDRDPEALREASQRISDDRFQAVAGTFEELWDNLDRLGLATFDKALMDLGVSSHQLDSGERGFSFQQSGPLDMRMDPTRGRSAAELVGQAEESELADIIYRYGEEKKSRRVARAIVEARRQAPIETTARLAEIVAGAVGKSGRIHPATRTFQALRIAVNEELEQLEEGLATVAERLAVGGRVAVMSYHSLEDRMVKSTFADLAGRCSCPRELPVCVCNPRRIFKVLTRKPITASPKEVQENPRARSARLRVAEKIAV